MCSKTTSSGWPVELDIDFALGLKLTLILWIGLLLWEILLTHLTGIGFRVASLGPLIIFTLINISKLILLYVIITRLGNINIRGILLYKLPSLKECLKWSFLGACSSIIDFIALFREGYGPQHPTFVTYILCSMISFAIAGPLREEIIFRGICYAAFRKKLGKAYAYFFSVLFFLLSHIWLDQLILHGTINLTLYNVFSIVLVGVVTAYIYESTHKLLLCIVFHGSSNAATDLSLLAGYIIGGYTVHVPID